MVRILVVDNDPAAAAAIEKLLRAELYEVTVVNSEASGRAELASKRYDVAIIDLRLGEGNKPGDTSGLDLARNSDPLIPKIIVSSGRDRDGVMKAISVGKEGFAVAVDFIERNEIRVNRDDLIDAVRKAYDTRQRWIRLRRDNISGQLANEYREVQRQARLQNYIHLIVNLVFAGFMIYAALEVHLEKLQLLYTMIAVVAGEVTNLLLERKKGEALNHRAEAQHTELLQAYRFEQLLTACDSIVSIKEAEQVRIQLIAAATASWVGPRPIAALSPPAPEI
jgi:CheY-like chemotaxis protein